MDHCHLGHMHKSFKFSKNAAINGSYGSSERQRKQLFKICIEKLILKELSMIKTSQLIL